MSLVLLVAAALVVAAGAIYAEQRSYLNGRADQRSYLNGRADQSAEAAAVPVSYALGVDARQLSVSPKERRASGVGRAPLRPLGDGLLRSVPWGTFGELVGPDGAVLRGPIQASDGPPLASDWA